MELEPSQNLDLLSSEAGRTTQMEAWKLHENRQVRGLPWDRGEMAKVWVEERGGRGQGDGEGAV